MRSKAMRVIIVLLALLVAGCGDARRESLAEAVRQTANLLRQPELAKLGQKHKGTPQERLVAAFFSREGQKLWPPRGSQEFTFTRPTPDQWPPRIILLDRPDAPWSVVVTVESEGHIAVSGYGNSLDKPLMTQKIDL